VEEYLWAGLACENEQSHGKSASSLMEQIAPAGKQGRLPYTLC